MIGVLGATITILATTADDAIWLVPYVSNPSLPPSTRIIHACVFILTLQCLAILCVIVAVFCETVIPQHHNKELILEMIGALTCWLIAIVLFLRKMLKKKKRRKNEGSIAASDHTSNPDYGTVPVHTVSPTESNSDSNSNSSEQTMPQPPSPCTILTLTTMGFLDEVSYFPSLILGKVFSPFDLCLGTLFAACILLLVLHFCLARWKPVLDWLDGVPLWGVVAGFAFVLSVEVLVDWLTEEREAR